MNPYIANKMVGSYQNVAAKRSLAHVSYGISDTSLVQFESDANKQKSIEHYRKMIQEGADVSGLRPRGSNVHMMVPIRPVEAPVNFVGESVYSKKAFGVNYDSELERRVKEIVSQAIHDFGGQQDYQEMGGLLNSMNASSMHILKEKQSTTFRAVTKSISANAAIVLVPVGLVLIAANNVWASLGLEGIGAFALTLGLFGFLADWVLVENERFRGKQR